MIYNFVLYGGIDVSLEAQGCIDFGEQVLRGEISQEILVNGAGWTVDQAVFFIFDGFT